MYMKIVFGLTASLFIATSYASDFVQINCKVNPDKHFQKAKEEAYRNGLVQQVESLKNKGVIDRALSVDDYLRNKIAMHASEHALRNTVVEVDVYVNNADGYVKWSAGKVELGTSAVLHEVNRVSTDYTLYISGERQLWSDGDTVVYQGTCNVEKVNRSF